MVLPAVGNEISFGLLRTEYGRDPNSTTALGDYYGNASDVGTTGEIAISQFRGKSFVSSNALPRRNFYLVYQNNNVVKNNARPARLVTGTDVLLQALSNPGTNSFSNTYYFRDATTGSNGSLRHAGFSMWFDAFTTNNFDFLWVPEKSASSSNALQFYNYYGPASYMSYNSDQLLIKRPNSNDYWFIRVPFP